jgi:predicted O-methyltransferase YrrM
VSGTLGNINLSIDMSNYAHKIRNHWINRDNYKDLMATLERGGSPVAELDIDRLSSRDQMHAGLLDATKTFVEWIGLEPGSSVLDLGSGLGGSARFLASSCSVAVTAVELCPELNEAATRITRHLGLSDRIDHLCMDITAPCDLKTSGFDLVWIQHVDMQVAKKSELYTCAAEHLAKGGRVVWHDWLAGPGGPVIWPLFWSADGEISCLADMEEFTNLLESAGLEIARLEPIPDLTSSWFEKSRSGLSRVISKMRSSGSTSLKQAAITFPFPSQGKAGMGSKLKVFESLATEVDNALLNIREERLIPFFGEAVRRGGSPCPP